MAKLADTIAEVAREDIPHILTDESLDIVECFHPAEFTLLTKIVKEEALSSEEIYATMLLLDRLLYLVSVENREILTVYLEKTLDTLLRRPSDKSALTDHDMFETLIMIAEHGATDALGVAMGTSARRAGNLPILYNDQVANIWSVLIRSVIVLGRMDELGHIENLMEQAWVYHRESVAGESQVAYLARFKALCRLASLTEDDFSDLNVPVPELISRIQYRAMDTVIAMVNDVADMPFEHTTDLWRTSEFMIDALLDLAQSEQNPELVGIAVRLTKTHFQLSSPGKVFC